LLNAFAFKGFGSPDYQQSILGLALLLPLVTAAFAESPAIHGITNTLVWQNIPTVWHIEHSRELTIRFGKETDWFVDSFDGTVHHTAPILLFTPSDAFVRSARVKVGFDTKMGRRTFMVWADDHHWAKLSFELSPAKQPTMVTVVTRVLSDDCNSIAISGNTVYIQIAKSVPAYVFCSSPDGKSWQVLRVFSF
jgi:uncharacterized protein